MTLARKVFLMMEMNRAYTINRLVDMLIAEYDRVFNELVEAGDMDAYLNEEWMQACETSTDVLRSRVREALTVTRKFGYTKVEVEDIAPYFVPYRRSNGKIVRFYHDGFKKFSYIRIRK